MISMKSPLLAVETLAAAWVFCLIGYHLKVVQVDQKQMNQDYRLYDQELSWNARGQTEKTLSKKFDIGLTTLAQIKIRTCTPIHIARSLNPLLCKIAILRSFLETSWNLAVHILSGDWLQ